MQYFKNSQLTEMYGVSFDAVRNWIQNARDGKVNLQLHAEGDKWYIVNTAKNQAVMNDLVVRGKKYKNTRGFKALAPKPSFYQMYSREQILDIISNIVAYREIPLQYGFFDGGADYWDEYEARLLTEESSNSLTNALALIDSNLDNIDRLVGAGKRVNVIDLGLGNAMPMRGLLTHLQQSGKLNRYIGIDLSRRMLDLAERNIQQWFGGKVVIEKHQRDFSLDRFNDLIVDDRLINEADAPVNLVVLLGGTLGNLRTPNDVLRIINKSMAPNDLLLYGSKLDSPNTRRYFDFGTGAKVQPLATFYRQVLDLLTITPDLYDIEQLFDENQRARQIRVRLKVAISIQFSFGGHSRTIELGKGEALLIWRARHATTHQIIDQFATNDFRLLHASTTRDNEYLLSMYEMQAQ